ncbi:MAG: hypothetical protein RBT81_04525 [Gammaproteobacteria bacterium]|nr:hypothetical protein [Gammaproteobacteria bacterium]
MKTIISAAAAIALGFGAAGALHAEGLQSVAGSQKSFEEVDSDGDGNVTREEADSAGISINWEEADPDGNGSLTREEYESATQDSGSSM